MKGTKSLPGHAHEHPFPLPFMLAFIGYTIILLLDKVLFDAHAAFDLHGHGGGHGHSHDPVE